MAKKSSKKFRLTNQRIWLIGTAIIASLLVAGIWLYKLPLPTLTDSRIKVVAAENFWGDIASQIGGPEVRVTSIVSDPTIDPHLYESDPKDAAALASAQLVITNGLGYDDFIDKLLAASENSHRRLISAAHELNLEMGVNPHLWYDPNKAMVIATAISRELGLIDPTHQALYQHRLAQFQNDLLPLQTTIAQIKARYQGSGVAFTERVSGYLLSEAGLTVKSPAGYALAVEEGNEPSPGDVLTMEHLISSRDCKVLIYNAQVTSPLTEHLRTLAGQAGVPVVAVTETMPSTSDFQSWQLSQAKDLLATLGG